MDFGKCLSLALVPAAVFAVLGIATSVLENIPVLNFLLCIVGIPLVILDFLILGYAGFNAAKKGQDLAGGTVSGFIAGAVGSLISGIVNAILVVLGLGVGAAANGVNAGTAIIGAASIIGTILGLILAVVFWSVGGAILGAIGAFVASQQKPAAPKK